MLVMVALVFGPGTAKAAESDPERMTSRAKAHILGLVLPDFPPDLAPGVSREVTVRIVVAPTGLVDSVRVTSPPSPIDAQVIGAVANWYIVPAACSNSAWTASEVRTAVAFAWEGDRKFVTVRDPRWYAIGEQVELAAIGGTSHARPVLEWEQPLDPMFPRALLRRKQMSGIVVARFRVDAGGAVSEVLHTVAWPSPLLDASVRSALRHGKVRRTDRQPIVEPFDACVEVTFKLAPE